METENRKKSEGEGVKSKEESLLERVQFAVAETIGKMNDEIPRPSLKWNRKDWSVIKEQLFNGDVSNLELLTTFCFFLKRPLRKLANLGCEVLGN